MKDGSSFVKHFMIISQQCDMNIYVVSTQHSTGEATPCIWHISAYSPIIILGPIECQLSEIYTL